jgi:phosphatidylinositol N-acetylglucosaminyltransferase subunit A
MMRFSLQHVTHAICVSNTGRENFVLRSGVEPERVAVIPNALDTTVLTPDPAARDAAKSPLPPFFFFFFFSISILRAHAHTCAHGRFIRLRALASAAVMIVTVNRLVYRKGVDLLLGVIPLVCQRFPAAYFLIGGEGPKRLELEEMIERARSRPPALSLSLSLSISQFRSFSQGLLRGN